MLPRWNWLKLNRFSTTGILLYQKRVVAKRPSTGHCHGIDPPCVRLRNTVGRPSTFQTSGPCGIYPSRARENGVWEGSKRNGGARSTKYSSNAQANGSHGSVLFARSRTMSLTVSRGPPIVGCCHFFAENQGASSRRCEMQPSKFGLQGWLDPLWVLVVARGDAGGGLRRHAWCWCIGCTIFRKNLLWVCSLV